MPLNEHFTIFAHALLGKYVSVAIWWDLSTLRSMVADIREHILGVGDHFQVPEVSEGTCTGKACSGVGDHFQVLEVSERT